MHAFQQALKKSCQNLFTQEKSTRKFWTPEKTLVANLKPEKGLRTAPSII